MDNETFKQRLQQLADKVKRIQSVAENCEHSYKSQGFSKIAHPETAYQFNPSVRSIADIKYASWYCEHCGNRISTEEYNEFQTKWFEEKRNLDLLQEMMKRKLTD